MEQALSTILQKPIWTSEGEMTLLGVLIDSENGKIWGFRCAKGFLSSEFFRPQENGWTYKGVIAREGKGEDWRKFRVENRRGVNRGRISEIWITVPGYQVNKFECTQRICWFFSQKRIFAAEDIFEVLPKKRLVIVEEENRIFQPIPLGVENLNALSG